MRTIGTTRIDLKSEVDAERFRLDLYYELAGAELYVPPLRQRGDDVLLLFDYHVRAMSARLKQEPPKLSASDVTALLQHSWTGNTRELKNIAERFAVGISPLDAMLRAPGGAAPAQNSLRLSHRVSAFERNLLLAALKEAKGSMDDAARILKTPARTLRHKLRQHKIDRKTFLT